MKKTLEDVKGIGPAGALLLKKAGITSVSELAAADIDQISSVKGFGRISAARLIEEAKSLLSEAKKSASEVIESPTKTTSVEPSPSKKRGADKKKKDKKSDKKKREKSRAGKKEKKKKKKDKKRGKKK